ncbi:hypothetical protein [Aureimonas pseudogalii]|uniref:Uncharacterized protein n=1 Tax=Aureimonas pseudogalii TaxID=1744844 RepID=A0A7W6ML66_9HYPH|nr:hypothetical protein [Aureimonas pseudogalii]MBB3999460.1 hypothetical protein [Aureimonas pseudogalii]
MPNPTASPIPFLAARSPAPALWRRAMQALVRLDRHLIALGDPGAVPGPMTTRRSGDPGARPAGHEPGAVSSLLL